MPKAVVGDSSAFDGAVPPVPSAGEEGRRRRDVGVGATATVSAVDLSVTTGSVESGGKDETRLNYTAQVDGSSAGTSNSAVSDLTKIFLAKAAAQIGAVRKKYKLNAGQLLVKVKAVRPKNAQSGNGQVEFSDVAGKGISNDAINELKKSLQGLAADYKITDAIVKGIFEVGSGDSAVTYQSGRTFNITLDCAQQTPVS